MSHDDYVAEAMRQLTREEHYRLLDRDPTTKYAEEITKLLAELKARNAIDQETKDYLTPLHVRTARFYLLPKIHKPGNPGRPIVSSCGAPTEKISQFVDYHLRPLVENLPSFIKDTTSFITKLQSLNNIPEGTLLVTLDVSSLYTNIPHHEGIEACTEALNTRTTQQPPTEDLAELINQILTKNNLSLVTSTSYKFMEQPWAPAWPPPMQTSLWANLNNYWPTTEKSQQYGGDTLMTYSPSGIMERKV